MTARTKTQKPRRKRCPYCSGGKIIHTNSHCWDEDPITDMGCYKSFDGMRLHGFAQWKFCPICGQEINK